MDDNLKPKNGALMTLYQLLDKPSFLVGKKRKEATQQENRELAKRFVEAKKVDNDVFQIADLRKVQIRNFVKGR